MNGKKLNNSIKEYKKHVSKIGDIEAINSISSQNLFLKYFSFQ